MVEKKVLPGKPTCVAEYIAYQIHLCGKKQLEIAEDTGFDKPNIITMIKQGKTKLPLEKIGRFAKAINVDPVHLFKLCMAEYQPETWIEIQRMFDQPILTQNEMEIIEVIREADIENPRIRDDDDRQRLTDVINSLGADNT